MSKKKKKLNKCSMIFRGHTEPQVHKELLSQNGSENCTLKPLVINLFHVMQKHAVTVRAGTAGGSKSSKWPLHALFCPNWHQTHSSGFTDRWNVVETMWRENESGPPEGELVKTARRAVNYPAQLQVQPLRRADGRASLPEQAWEYSR